jgi:hypothetical protein
MQIFQSWVDIVIMLVLAFAYIVTFIAQRNVIKSKNEAIGDLTLRSQELERTSRTSLSVASERSKDIELFKEMYNKDLLKQYLQMNINVEVNKVKAVAEQQSAEDKKMIETMNDYLNEGISYIAFMLYAEKKYSREQRIQFFHTYFDKGKDLYWHMTNQKIELVENRKGLQSM